MATLDQVIGPGTAKLELTFVSNEKVEARYINCRTNIREICDANSALLCAASGILQKKLVHLKYRIFGN